MGHRTIPAPSNDEFQIALTGLRNAARSHRVDVNQLEVHEFILQAAEFQAQQAAEIRWLHNIIQNRIQS
jgi:hypothetical protein